MSNQYDPYVENFYRFLHRYFGIKPPVDAQKEIERKKVRSSNLKSIGYLPEKQLLEIEFKRSGRYRYPFTKQEMYNELMKSKSKGKYFHKHIRPTDLYEKIGKI